MSALKRKPKKPETTGTPQEKSIPQSAPVRGSELSRAKKWVFSIVGFVLVPLLLLALVELGLRVAGYGYSPNFFKRIKKINEDFLVENDKFGLRFFPPELARSPAPTIMKAEKPPGTFRIFLLGESAAMGDPRPAYGPGRYLQVMLQERFPGARFEVVCVAMTAINSHSILPIARECARHEGDLWIVYMGNNEMVGPFGATKVFGSKSPSAWQVRLVVGAQRWRVGQLVMALGRKFLGGSKGSSWGGMQMFMENRVEPNEPRKKVIYENFRENLGDIVHAGLNSGASVLLSSVACNLRDCPPFASMGGDTRSESEKAAAAGFRNAGATATSLGNLTEASRAYEEAARRDPLSAELEYLAGESQLRLSNGPVALKHFEKSRDLDALPFRADTPIEQILSEAGKAFAGQRFAFCDAVAVLATNSPWGIPGKENFYEHVHFNFDGNYRLARAWAATMEPLLPSTLGTPAASGWASQETCERLLGLTDWNRASVLEDMLRRYAQPPFTNQINHLERMEEIRRELQDIRHRLTKDKQVEARAIYISALERDPQDYRVHENFAEFLEHTGDLARAADEWQRVRAIIPEHHLAYFQAGRLLALQGNAIQAEDLLSRALELRPDLSEGWLELGKAYASEGKYELALKNYERARKLLPQDYRVYLQMGKALSRLNRRSEAIQQFQAALQRRPDSWETLYAYGEELAFDKKVREAREQFEKVLRIKPDYAMAHLNLGVALVQEGQLDEALRQFQETLRLEPNNTLASNYLFQVQAHKEKK